MAQTFLPLFLIAHRIADRARDLGGQFLSGAVPRGLRRLLRRFILVSDGFHAVPQHLNLAKEVGPMRLWCKSENYLQTAAILAHSSGITVKNACVDSRLMLQMQHLRDRQDMLYKKTLAHCSPP